MTIGECNAILEVNPGVTLREVRNAWKLQAEVWHPDRFQQNPRLRDNAEAKLKEIKSAYDRFVIEASASREIRCRRERNKPNSQNRDQSPFAEDAS